MGLFNWLMHRKMKKEAKRLAAYVSDLYPQSKAKLGNVSEKEIVIGMVFDKDTYAKVSEQSRKKFETICITVNGFCYLKALDFGIFNGVMTFRALQFTRYMDIELENAGFPKQTKQQKEQILKAMDLALDGWEKWTKD